MAILFRVFKTLKNYYLYDTKTNRIINIPASAYNKLKKCQSEQTKQGILITKDDLDRPLNEKEKTDFKSLGVLDETDIRRISVLPPNYNLEKAISFTLKHLVLEITRDCNCKCDYCIYGGGYNYQKVHAPLRMKKDVSQRAISIFIDSSKNSSNILISFTGGEPFLEYSIIKSAIEFANGISNKKLRYFVNTNGMLLNESRLDYLAENNVDLRFSIDGPKDIHDKHRRTKTNVPTYDKVIKNIQYLYQQHRDYFDKHISFSIVLSEPSRIDEVFHFFYSIPMFKDAEKIFSPVNPYDRKEPYYTHYPKEMDKSLKRLHDQYIRLWISEDNPAKSLLHFSFGKLLLEIHNRKLDHINRVYHPSDCCIPAIYRLICKVDGQFGFCDKQAYAWDIGDVWDGINISRIYDIIREYCLISEKLCKNCWAIRFCRSCFSFASQGEKISIDKMKQSCGPIKLSVSIALNMYADIMEHNPKAFDNYI